MTYAEYLKANGATDEDVKLLDTPVARKAFQKMQEDNQAAMTKYRAEMETWHQGVEEVNQKLLKERDSAKLAEAGAQAQLKAAQEAGLIELAEKANPGSTQPKSGETPAFDPKAHNLVTNDLLLTVAEKEGDAIAVFADISREHERLFPGQEISFRELRREAVANRKSVEQHWMDKYGVPAARAAKSAADKAAYETKLRAEGYKEAETKIRSEYGNPLTAPPRVSMTPFTDKPPSAITDAHQQPWNRNPSVDANSRVARVMAKINGTGGNA